MSGNYARWLKKKMRGIKWLTILMIIAGLPIFFLLVNSGLMSPEYVIVYYFFYMMAWATIHYIMQLIKKPAYLKKERARYIAANSDLPDDIKDAIIRGKVIKGMNAHMCSVSTGRMYRELVSDNGETIITTIEKNVKGSML